MLLGPNCDRVGAVPTPRDKCDTPHGKREEGEEYSGIHCVGSDWRRITELSRALTTAARIAIAQSCRSKASIWAPSHAITASCHARSMVANAMLVNAAPYPIALSTRTIVLVRDLPPRNR